MKNICLYLCVFIACITTSCATISGGTRYNAHIKVDNQPNADIYFNNQLVGVGQANVKIKRLQARNLQLSVEVRGCSKEHYTFYGDKTRNWAYLWYYPVNFLFVGTLIDVVGGAWRKPNDSDPRITKINLNNYNYNLNYTGCNQ